jgi:hypothetical protein
MVIVSAVSSTADISIEPVIAYTFPGDGAALAADVVEIESGANPINTIRNAVTGGAYALSTDANGRMRVVDGTGAGEIDLLSGYVKFDWTQSTRLYAGAMYCDAGSDASTIVDADLTPVDPAYDDFYQGFWLTMLSGPNTIISRRISAYDAAATTLTVSPPFPNANAVGNVYSIQGYGPQMPNMTSAYLEDDFNLTQQETRDAMKLAPTAGSPAAGSVDEHLDDILEDTERIGAISVTITNAMAQDETITVVRGDDYLVANGRHMVIDLDNAPSLTGGSIAFTGGGMSGVTPIIVDADTIHLEFTAAQTAAIDPAVGPYELVLTDASGYIATIVTGQLVSTRSP